MPGFVFGQGLFSLIFPGYYSLYLLSLQLESLGLILRSNTMYLQVLHEVKLYHAVVRVHLGHSWDTVYMPFP